MTTKVKKTIPSISDDHQRFGSTSTIGANARTSSTVANGTKRVVVGAGRGGQAPVAQPSYRDSALDTPVVKRETLGSALSLLDQALNEQATTINTLDNVTYSVRDVPPHEDTDVEPAAILPNNVLSAVRRLIDDVAHNTRRIQTIIGQMDT